MRYTYYDLGDQRKDSAAIVRLHGSSANVILLDDVNFCRYRAGQPFRYQGGFCRRSPARLPIPDDGRWHLVVDLGGYRGRVRATVEMVASGTARTGAMETQPEAQRDDAHYASGRQGRRRAVGTT